MNEQTEPVASHDPSKRSIFHPHISPVRHYFYVYVLLVIFLGVTVWAALLDLGPLNIPIAMAIAIVKTILVVLFFIHLLYGTRLTKVWAVAGIFFLTFMFLLSMSDFRTRFFPERGWHPVEPVQPKPPPGG